MSPWNPVNHAWLRGGDSVPYSAVPVLPETSPPGMPSTAPPVPSVTTPRIRPRRASVVGASSATPAAGWGSSGSMIRRGVSERPLATEADASATANGLASTLPWPIMLAACSVSLSVTGTEPPNTGTPRSSSRYPSFLAVSASCWAEIVRDWPTNAVLHESAKSLLNGTAPSTSPSALRNSLPTTMVAGQSTTVSGVRPFSSSASAEAILNVEPGGYFPTSARL